MDREQASAIEQSLTLMAASRHLRQPHPTAMAAPKRFGVDLAWVRAGRPRPVSR
jgi:hypothetical protein